MIKNHNLSISGILGVHLRHEQGGLSEEEMEKFVDSLEQEDVKKLIMDLGSNLDDCELSDAKSILSVLGVFTEYPDIRLEAIKVSKKINGFAPEFAKKLTDRFNHFLTEEEKLLREINYPHLTKT